MEFNDLKQKVRRLYYQKENLINEIQNNKKKIKILTIDRDNFIQARWILSEVTKATQEDFKNKVEKLTTIALKSVFNKNYEFKLLFESKRNKMEARPVILEDGKEFTPKDELGGSILNIISFMVQIVFIILEKPAKRKTMILDEPFHWLGNLKEKAGRMLTEISKELGMQIIFVTHDKILAEIADVIYKVENINKVSKVKKVK